MPDPKKKLDLSAGNAILKSSQKIDLSAGDAILKKKESTQPTSQESVWGSNSQPKDAYTSLVIDQQIPRQVSDVSSGEQPKMRTLGVDITAEEALKPTVKAPTEKFESAKPYIKKAQLKNELAKTKVSAKNQDEVNRKIDEVAKLDKQTKQIEQERFNRIEQDFINSKDTGYAELEADRRLNDLLSNTGIWNNVKSFAKEAYNTAIGGLSGLTDEKSLLDLKVDTDPLSEEKNEIKKLAAKKNLNLSDQEVSEKAKQLFKNKQIEGIENDRIASFLENLPEDDKIALKQDRYNTSIHLQEENIKNERAINAYTLFGNKKIEEYKAIENQLKALKEKGIAFPEDLYNKYISLSSDIKNIAQNIQKRQDSLLRNNKDLGTAKQEFDLLKRQYGDVENFLMNTGLMAQSAAVNILGGLDYAASLGGLVGDSEKNMSVQKDVIAANDYINSQKEFLRKSVESIESVDGLVNYVSDIVANQIPNLVVTSTGSKGLAAMGTMAAGQKYSEMNKEVLDGKASYSPAQMALAPLFYGAAEVVSEIPTLSILKKGGRVIDAVAKNQADLLTKTAVQKGKEFAKDFLGDQAKEIAGEEFTNFAQNVNDKFLLGKKDVGLLDNTGTVFKDTFTLTSVLKVAPHLFGLAVKPFQSKTDLGVLDENSRKILQFSRSLNTLNLSEDERKVIQGQIDRATTENSKIIANTIDNIVNMPDQTYLKVNELNKKAAQLKDDAKVVNDGNLPNKADILKDLENQYRDIQTERSSIINTKYSPYAQLESLPSDELVDLKNEAQRKLMSELNPDGTKDITITDDQISKEALNIYKEKNKSVVTEEVTVEAPAIEVTQEATTETTPQTYVEELAKTKESDPETYWSVSEVSEEDAAKGTIIDTPDGSALVKPDGDIAGVFKKLTSKAKGVAQDLLNKAIAAGGIKLDNFDGYLTKQYKKAGFRVVSRTPFNEQYAPEGWNKEKHGTPDVVAMVYDPNNELDIEEKVFENPETGYDEAITYRDGFVGQAKALTTEANTVQEVIDESEKSNDLPSLVQKAKNALSKILPNTKIILYNTEAEYKAAINEGTDDNSGGAFVQGKIHINPNRANGRTVAHEVFHAILLNMVKSDPAAQRVTAAMITAIEKVLPPDMKAKLQDFVENGYDAQRELWDEEKLAELVGYLAENFSSLSQPAKNIIKQWLDQLAKLVGLKEFTDKEVIDFMNTISGKIASGEEITEEDVKILKPKSTGTLIKRFQANFTDPVSKVEFVYDKNTEDFNKLEKEGFITKDKSINDFNGQVIFLHQPDAAFSGLIYKNGELLVEGKGGVYYPIKFHKDGFFWASTSSTANKMAKDLNAARKANGGKLLMALTTAPSDKLLSSTTAANGVMEIVISKAFDKNFSINKTQVKNSLVDAANTSSVINGKKVGLGMNIKKGSTVEEVKSEIAKKLNPDKSSFADRKAFVEKLLSNVADIVKADPKAVDQFGKFFSEGIKNEAFKGKTKTGKLSISAANLKQGISEMLTEPMLKEGVDRNKGGQVYAILELNGDVNAVDSNKHESYPKAIQSADPNNKVTLHILKDRVKWNEVFEDPTTNKIVSKERELNIFPTSGVSTTGLKLNTENVSGRKQADTIKDRKQSNRPSVNQIYDQSEQAIKDRNKKRSIKDLGPYLRKSLLDRQAYIKRLLDRIDNKSAKKAYDLLVTKAGASALAAERFKQAEKEIYGKLNSEDTKTLDKIIYARRIVAVNESRTKLGMPAYTGINGYSLEDAKQDLADFKQELGDKKFNELSDRATTYFNVFKDNLRKLYDSGRISKEVYDSLRNTEYSPIKTIKYIIGDNLSPDEIDTQAKSLGISRKDIMKLSDSNENEIILDSKWLLAMNIGSVEGRAFENRMLNEFNKAIESTTADEKKAFEEFVLDNPVVGKKKDGGLKYKYDDAKVPVGYTKVSFFENGNKREIVLKDAYAKQLLDVKNKNTFLENIGKLTGTQILRFFATGGNPLFIIGNTAVDFQNIAFWSDTYSKFKPLAAAQLMRDFTKNFVKKAVMNNKYNAIFNEYINHGGALDYLSNDGLKALESMNPVKSVTKQAQKGLLAYGRAMAFLGETSEVAFRLSVFEKVKEDSLKDFRKENGREPNFQEKEDILWKAAREARETMDFSQGGDVAKNIDSVFPYFNAALQGVRRPIDFAMKNPAGFASSVLQYTAMAGSLTAASLAMLIKSVRDDEEDDDEANKKILQVLNSVSEYEKANYHVLFTGNKNKDGEYEYYRIKKLPVLSVISTIGDQLIYNDFFKNVGIDYKIDKEAIQEAAVKSNPLPMTVQELAGKNPVASGLVSYWANKDTFTGEKIFREHNNKKILPEAEGIFDDKVDQVYKDLAPGFGLSPARTKVMVEKVITSENTNPTIPLIYSAYDGIFNKKDGLGNEVSEAMSNVGKAFGKKLVRYTDKNIIRYKKQDEMEYKESVTETDIWKKEQKVYNEIKSAYKEGDGLTQKELVSLVKENFEPIDRLKYVKKYNTYIHNMNIDKSVLDIIFEDVPEVQAMKLNQRYGANLEKEEMKELGQAMGSAGRKINTKAMYIYNKRYKERKPAN